MIGANAQAPGVHVWVATAPVDMRKSFDSLSEVVRTFLGHDPRSGSLFVFRNRNAQRVKVLWYDREGPALFYQRLDRGTFPFPKGDERVLAIDATQLSRLLSGLEVVTRHATPA
jgi:transposase